MKTSIKAIVASACALPVCVFAQSNVTIYGVADSGIVHQRSSAGNLTSLTGGGQSGSRLGLRGTEDLGGGLRSFFTLESGLNLDNGTNTLGAFWGRQIFVGVQGSAGAISFGRQMTPFYKDAVLKGDPFSMGLLGCICTLTSTFVRTNNAVSYVSPTRNGVTGSLFYSLGETAGDFGAGAAYSGSLTYASGRFYGAFGLYNQNTAASNDHSRAMMLTGVYTLPKVALYGAFQQVRSTQAGVPGTTKVNTDVDVFWLSAKVPIGPHAMIFGAARSSDRREVGNTGASANQFSVAYTHALSKRTSLYTSVSRVINRNGAEYKVLDATTPAYGTSGIQFGVRHLF